MNALKSKAKRCCSIEHERLIDRLEACEIGTNTDGDRHACYRQAARISGDRAKECIAVN